MPTADARSPGPRAPAPPPATPPAAYLAQHGHRLGWIAAGVITLVAALLRFPGLGEFWLNPDEGIYYSVIAWPDLAQRRAEIAENAHPPLFYHLLWLWSRVSMDFAWLRAPAALAGTAAVLGAFLLGRELVGGACGIVTGLVAALLVAVAPAMVTLSQLIRPYTLQVATILFAFYGLALWHNQRARGGGRAGLVLFALCATVALLTHYSSVFALAAGAAPFLVLLVQRRLPRRALLDLAAAAALPFAAALFVYVTHVRSEFAAGLQAWAYQTWLRPHLANELADAWWQTLGFVGYELGDPLAGAGLTALLVALAVAVWQRAPVVWLASVVAFALAALVSLLHVYPFGPARHSVYLTPFLVLPIAWAIARGLTAPLAWRGGTLAALAALGLARTELYYLLHGGKRVTTLGAEKVMLCSDLARIRPALDQLQATPGLLAMSIETYRTLGPLWQEEREQARVVDGLRTFRWGLRDVFVHSEWWLSMQATALGKGTHVHDFLQKADRVLPDLQVGKQTRLAMVFAGFHTTDAEALLKWDSERPPQQRLVASPREVKGLVLFDLDAVRFLALAPRPPGDGTSTGR